MTTWWRRVRRQADTAYLMFAAIVSGAAGLTVPGAKSQSLVASLPPIAQVIWYGGLLVGGLLGGMSILLGRRVGLILERPARWLLAFLCAAFGVAVISAAGAPGITGAAFVGLFGLACVARAWEVRQELRAPSVEQRLRAELQVVRAEVAALRAEFPRGEGL